MCVCVCMISSSRLCHLQAHTGLLLRALLDLSSQAHPRISPYPAPAAPHLLLSRANSFPALVAARPLPLACSVSFGAATAPLPAGPGPPWAAEQGRPGAPGAAGPGPPWAAVGRPGAAVGRPGAAEQGRTSGAAEQGRTGAPGAAEQYRGGALPDVQYRGGASEQYRGGAPPNVRDAPHAAAVERSVLAAIHPELALLCTRLPIAQRAGYLPWICAQLARTEEQVPGSLTNLV